MNSILIPFVKSILYTLYIMTSTYHFTIEKLYSQFQQIQELYQEIQSNRAQIQEKLIRVKDIYNNLIKPNNKKNFLFCLDTFFFQYKVLNIEMDNLNRYISLINNRMYGDYYKLYNMLLLAPIIQDHGLDHVLLAPIIQDHGLDHVLLAPIIQDHGLNHVGVDVSNTILLDVSSNKVSKNYSIYKDLEPFHEYPITDSQSLYEDIIQCVNCIFAHYSKKNDEIQEYNTNQIGLSIDSFINTLEYENALVHEQIVLYIGHIEFFHKTQTDYLTKLLYKIRGFHVEVDADLHLQEPMVPLCVAKTNLPLQLQGTYGSLVRTLPLQLHGTDGSICIDPKNDTVFTITGNRRLP